MFVIKNFHPNIQKTEAFVNEIEIIKVTAFDEEALESFSKSFEKALNTGQSVIPIWIDSFGGEVYSLLGMIDIIKSSPVPVATILVSKAMSCGSVLLSCGADGMRFMSENSTIMIHEISIGTWDKMREVQSMTREAERLNKKIFQIMSENCGHKKGYFWKLQSSKKYADHYITAEEALEFNLVNHIGIPRLKVDVQQITTLDLPKIFEKEKKEKKKK